MFSSLIGLHGLSGESGRLPILLQTAHFDPAFLGAFALGCLLSAPVWPRLKGKLLSSRPGRIASDLAALFALIACIAALAVGSYNPFIYFRF